MVLSETIAIQLLEVKLPNSNVALTLTLTPAVTLTLIEFLEAELELKEKGIAVATKSPREQVPSKGAAETEGFCSLSTPYNSNPNSDLRIHGRAPPTQNKSQIQGTPAEQP